jgi:peroxiredoxin
MALTQSQVPKFGSQAPDFLLPGVDGKHWSLSDFKDRKALVIAFICNHCPYVIAVQGRINALAKEYAPKGVALIGINSNNAEKYPPDSFDAMKTRAREQGYVFPYLRDESQKVAREYGAVCTPDFFVYENAGGKFALRYAGRLDDSWKDESSVKRRDLALALDEILAGREPSRDQQASMGCSIKWK